MYRHSNHFYRFFLRNIIQNVSNINGKRNSETLRWPDHIVFLQSNGNGILIGLGKPEIRLMFGNVKLDLSTKQDFFLS